VDKINIGRINMGQSSSISYSWRCVAITLDKKGKRFKSFLENNNHLSVSVFDGIKGSSLSNGEIISRGIATEELVRSRLLSYGHVGCAVSHKIIWDKVAKGSEGCFVLEDDCYTHPKITEYISNNLEVLMKIDICFFGINTNSIMKSVSPIGLTKICLFHPPHPSHEWIDNAFLKTNIRNIELYKLIKAFGTCAYFITPHGAKKLSQQIFPLSLETTSIPLITDQMVSFTIDRAGCRVYRKVDAYVCQPFLAYTPNLDSSTNI